MTSTNTTHATGKVERTARLRWVPIAKMRVNPLAQRGLTQSRVDALAANFDLEEVGTPTVNEREGHYYIIDGQHRVEALKAMGWGDQQIQCWAYAGLTEEQEADKFSKLNNTLGVSAFEKFKVGVSAGYEIPCDIDRVVRAQGLSVSKERAGGGIRAVAVLQRVYARGGAPVLARTLRITRDAFGEVGLEGPVIEGLGLLCSRYNGSLDDEKAVEKLGKAHGGVGGLLNKAAVLRKQTGNTHPHCVAAAAVDTINSGRGGGKLPNWWTTA